MRCRNRSRPRSCSAASPRVSRPPDIASRRTAHHGRCDGSDEFAMHPGAARCSCRFTCRWTWSGSLGSIFASSVNRDARSTSVVNPPVPGDPRTVSPFEVTQTLPPIVESGTRRQPSPPRGLRISPSGATFAASAQKRFPMPAKCVRSDPVVDRLRTTPPLALVRMLAPQVSRDLLGRPASGEAWRTNASRSGRSSFRVKRRSRRRRSVCSCAWAARYSPPVALRRSSRLIVDG